MRRSDIDDASPTSRFHFRQAGADHPKRTVQVDVDGVDPILLGMPFGMFFIAMFISVEFLALLVLYLIESKEIED